MFEALADDPSDNENVAYLITTSILPGMEAASKTTRCRGSQPGRSANVKRFFDKAMKRLEEEYFSDYPEHNQRYFERRFRLPRYVFDRIANALFGRGLFLRRVDGLKKKAIHPLQRMRAALKM